MFIVKKKINGREYFYLVENYRDGVKVKRKTISYLGKDRENAEGKAREIKEGNNKIKKENSDSLVMRDKDNVVDSIFAIAQTRGLFFQTAEIYGGKSGFYTYGHLGKKLKTNFENLWRNHFLNMNDNFHEIQSNSILPEKVFRASGHVDNFNDPMVECKKCNSRFRADHLLENNGLDNVEGLEMNKMDELISKNNLKCPKCNGDFSEVKQFNMMFGLEVGFSGDKSYLGPETAQGVFISFPDEFKATRQKLPLGLASVDKAYRNEISPRQMFFRLREFTQAELQIFFDPDKIDEHPDWDEVRSKKIRVKLDGKSHAEDVSCEELNSRKEISKFYLYHVAKVQEFYLNMLKIPLEKFRFRELSEAERAFYNKVHFDVEVDLASLGGFKEVGGVHYRTDHDLSSHQKVSGKNFQVSIDGKKFIPHVLELSFGVDRNVWAIMETFFDSDSRSFSFPPVVSPIKAAVFPIIKKPEYEKLARDVLKDIQKDWNAIYDQSGSIGKRYARNDEVGTPYCVTVDDKSPEQGDVTIRDRDTKKQIRIKVSELRNVLRDLIEENRDFEDFE